MEEVRDLASSPKARESPTMDLHLYCSVRRVTREEARLVTCFLVCPHHMLGFPGLLQFPCLLRAGCLDILCSWSSLVDFAVFSP